MNAAPAAVNTTSTYYQSTHLTNHGSPRKTQFLGSNPLQTYRPGYCTMICKNKPEDCQHRETETSVKNLPHQDTKTTGIIESCSSNNSGLSTPKLNKCCQIEPESLAKNCKITTTNGNSNTNQKQNNQKQNCNPIILSPHCMPKPSPETNTCKTTQQPNFFNSVMVNISNYDLHKLTCESEDEEMGCSANNLQNILPGVNLCPENGQTLGNYSMPCNSYGRRSPSFNNRSGQRYKNAYNGKKIREFAAINNFGLNRAEGASSYQAHSHLNLRQNKSNSPSMLANSARKYEKYNKNHKSEQLQKLKLQSNTLPNSLDGVTCSPVIQPKILTDSATQIPELVMDNLPCSNYLNDSRCLGNNRNVHLYSQKDRMNNLTHPNMKISVADLEEGNFSSPGVARNRCFYD